MVWTNASPGLSAKEVELVPFERRWNAPTATPESMPFVFLAIGLLAGLLSGLFGIGGGIIIIPLLMFFAKFSSHTAIGTSLGAMLLPVGILGALQYYKTGNVHVVASAMIALGLFAGAYFGAKFGLSLNPQTVKRAFAVFLVLVATRVWFTA